MQPWLGEHAAPEKKAVRVVNDLISTNGQILSQCQKKELIQII